MGIQKQEFYEGAALHLLLRSGTDARISYESPCFVIDDRLIIHLKYSTAKRSPWGFTFTPEEQRLLKERCMHRALSIGLVCGHDGIASLPYSHYIKIAPISELAHRITCARLHRQHFEISGPHGTLSRKVPPSDWANLLKEKL